MELTGEALASLRRLMKNASLGNNVAGHKGHFETITIKERILNDKAFVKDVAAIEAKFKSDPNYENGGAVLFSAFLDSDRIPMKVSKHSGDIQIKINFPYNPDVNHKNKYGGGAKKKRAKSRRGRSRRRSRSRSKKR
jgi:hypothetical protein